MSAFLENLLRVLRLEVCMGNSEIFRMVTRQGPVAEEDVGFSQGIIFNQYECR